mmetsp:Transcript_86057/g.228178  ORF Transcript_86057/g.228178 Transcript_86057/m.228178 type:complete len:486 (-) Transcript_86057:358-1815(-)
MAGASTARGWTLIFACFFIAHSARVVIKDELLTASSSKVFRDAQSQRQARLSLPNKYDGFKMVSVHIRHEEQVASLQRIIQEHKAEIHDWSEDGGPLVGHREDLLLGPNTSDAIMAEIHEAGMAAEVMMQDVGKSIREEAAMNHEAFRQAASDGVSSDIVGKFASLEEITEWMSQLASEYSNVDVESIGSSFEGRPIHVLRIASRAARKKKAPIVLIECTAHPREWASPAACVWMIDKLLRSSDGQVKWLSDALEWHFIPVLNVDGYKYTHDEDRLWRKNRRNNQGKCDGVDLNRNYDFLWGTSGVSHDKCDDCYPGSGPFSEPETQAISKHILKYLDGGRNRIQAYIAFHAYCSIWLHPPGAGPKPRNFEEIARVGAEAAKRAKALYGQPYQSGSGPEALYAFSGSSADWANAEQGGNVKYTFTPELRPNDVDEDIWETGFILPLNEIPMASEEAWAGTKYIAEVVAKESNVARFDGEWLFGER